MWVCIALCRDEFVRLSSSGGVVLPSAHTLIHMIMCPDLEQDALVVLVRQQALPTCLP